MAKLERPNRARREYDGKYVVHYGGEACNAFVYFVVQKVACTSIKTALLSLFDLDTSAYERPRSDGGTVMAHSIFNDSNNQITRSDLVAGLDEKFRDYYKFAFVRNPWDRLVSCFANKFMDRRKGLGGPRSRTKAFRPDMSFAEFVELVHATPDEESNPHFQSQHMVVCDSQGQGMADFVGRFENLREDFTTVTQRIGASRLQLPHRQKSLGRSSKHYKDFYDERLKRLVAERYERDIETFGYSY